MKKMFVLFLFLFSFNSSCMQPDAKVACVKSGSDFSSIRQKQYVEHIRGWCEENPGRVFLFKIEDVGIGKQFFVGFLGTKQHGMENFYKEYHIQKDPRNKFFVHATISAASTANSCFLEAHGYVDASDNKLTLDEDFITLTPKSISKRK